MIRRVVNPPRGEWEALCNRAEADNNAEVAARVAQIVARVREGGDGALKAITREIDGVGLAGLQVGEAEFAAAEKAVSEEMKRAIETAAENIRAFHAAQLPREVDMQTMPGVRCVQRAVPIQRVGLYVPGGTAPLFSTVLMLGIPATVAGCPEMVLCTPPAKDGGVAPEILYAARVCGIKKVFKAGGAQAVSAMAVGTDTIPRVDKIFGPGNRYVTAAKQLLSLTDVAIDMPAGPSEVMVLADETAVPQFVAADLLSQAEHGADSQSVLVTGSAALADAVDVCVGQQLADLPRAEIARKALGHSVVVVFDSMDEVTDFASFYAPEHLIVSMAGPWDVAAKIPTAGSVFIGNYTPESAGDYASGTNHTLPTAGWARSFSGVNTESFMRRITYQELTREGLESLGPVVMTMARGEGLEAHSRGMELRLNSLKK
ncbi:MAG: histidinol dehydrogenase [Rikenellaceae bacterium]|jgi:histidinol dehydrogenase|nr:histidinol dehydrogenase [Rikenellaceae bacterium]